jgi:hypothetical protein
MKMKRMASKHRCFVCAVIFVGAVAALPAFSQSPAPGGPPAPSPELGKLSFLAGDWTCKGKAEESPMGPAHATQGKVRIRQEIGGFWYLGHYAETKTAVNPHPMVFHFLQGYDATAKTFVMDCFDAFGSHCHQTSAGWQDGKLVYTGESSGSGPAPTPVRDTFAKTGAASLEHTGEIQMEGKWITTDHETCKRGRK